MGRRITVAELMTEKELLRSIVDAARETGWRVYHSWTSIHSPRGYPDLVMVKDGRALAWEVKSAKGKVTPAQQEWLDALAAVPGIEARVIQPDDLDWAYKRLAGVLPVGCGTPPGQPACTDGTPLRGGEAAPPRARP